VIRHVQGCVRQACIREVQRSIAQSVKLLIEDKIKALGVGGYFTVYKDVIETRHGGVIIFQGMQNFTADNIKSLEGYDIAWVEEAQTLGERSLRLLRPTIRKDGSELWFSWNPENEEDPVDVLLRGAGRVKDARVVRVNYMDNPHLTAELRQEIAIDSEGDPEIFAHVWLGEYNKVTEGAIYAKLMIDMRNEGRLCKVPYNPAFEVHTAWDIGGDGTSIVFFQVVGREPRIIDSYMEVGTQLGDQVRILKEKGYNYGTHVLPHDAGHQSVRTGMTMVAQLEGMGLENCEVLPRDDIEPGIELVKALLPQLVVDEEKGEPFVRAMKNYQRQWNREHKVFSKKPLHNWSSHMADASRAMAVWLATRNNYPVVKASEPAYGYGWGHGGDTAWMV